jgi:hypothetical protein
MDAVLCTAAIIEAGCPAISASVRDPNLRETWSFTPAAEATQAQIDIGNQIIATIPVEPPPVPSNEQLVLFDHENRLRSFEGQPPLSLDNFTAKMTVPVRYDEPPSTTAKKRNEMMTLTTDGYVIEERAMTNVEQRPLQPPPTTPVYLPPQSTIQLAHATSDAVISGLAKSPYLLGVVVLVAIGAVTAAWFLNLLIQGQAFHLNHLIETQQKTQTELITLHKQEFDALLDMTNRLSMAAVASSPPPSLMPSTQPTAASPPGRPR